MGVSITIGTPFVQMIFNLSNFARAKLVTIHIFAFLSDKGQSRIKNSIEKRKQKYIERPIFKLQYWEKL